MKLNNLFIKINQTDKKLIEIKNKIKLKKFN